MATGRRPCRADFTPFPTAGVSPPWRAVTEDVQGWWLEPSRGFDMTPPYVLANVGTKTVASTFHPYSTATLRPGNLYVHPAAGDRAYVVVRWTAPASGSYLVDTVFTGMDSRGATTDPHVVLNGHDLFAGYIRGGLDTPTNVASYKKTISVAKGDTIDFAVGPGGNGYICDSTGLTAKIALVAPASGGTVYDAAADFTKESIAAKANPNGAWSYGYRGSAASSEFTLLPSSGVEEIRRTVGGDVEGWWLEPARGFDHSPPWLMKNMGAATVSSTFHPFSTATLRPGSLLVHPAAGDRAYVVVRWTAPASGSYLIDTVFTGMDSRGATTDPHVVLNGCDLFAGDIRGGLDTPTNVASYKKTISIAKGDTIDFAVGPGGNGYICDSTGLTAKIALVDGASLNVASQSSRITVAELAATKPHVLRPAMEPARAAGCEVSKTGFHKATIGDLIELQYAYPAAPTAAPGAVDIKQTPNGAIAASPLGTRTVDTAPAGRRVIVFYFEAKTPGNDTVTLVIDGSPYTYHFQVDQPQPAAGQAPAIHVYPDELKQGDKLSDGSGRSFEIAEATRLVWVDLQPGQPFPHNTRYVLVTASGMRTEQGQWWPVLNGKALWRRSARLPSDPRYHRPLHPRRRTGGRGPRVHAAGDGPCHRTRTALSITKASRPRLCIISWNCSRTRTPKSAPPPPNRWDCSAAASPMRQTPYSKWKNTTRTPKLDAPHTMPC